MKKKRTSTNNLAEVILKDLVTIFMVEIQCDNYGVAEIPIEDFKRDLIFFAQSGIFTDAVKWKYTVDGGNVSVSATIDPVTKAEIRIYMKANNRAIQTLSKTIFDKADEVFEADFQTTCFAL